MFAQDLLDGHKATELANGSKTSRFDVNNDRNTMERLADDVRIKVNIDA